MLEVATPPKSVTGRQLILDRSGKPVEIGEIVRGATGRPVFLDLQRHPIDRAHPVLKVSPGNRNIIERFLMNGIPLFINSTGDIVDVVSPDEADGGVVMTTMFSLTSAREPGMVTSSWDRGIFRWTMPIWIRSSGLPPARM
jgi:hypothetical protein